VPLDEIIADDVRALARVAELTAMPCLAGHNAPRAAVAVVIAAGHVIGWSPRCGER